MNVAQPVEAIGSEPIKCGFESHHSHHGTVAKRLRRRSAKPFIGGSNPSRASIKKMIANVICIRYSRICRECFVALALNNLGDVTMKIYVVKDVHLYGIRTIEGSLFGNEGRAISCDGRGKQYFNVGEWFYTYKDAVPAALDLITQKKQKMLEDLLKISGIERDLYGICGGRSSGRTRNTNSEMG